jgi:hypothetical protein
MRTTRAGYPRARSRRLGGAAPPASIADAELIKEKGLDIGLLGNRR